MKGLLALKDWKTFRPGLRLRIAGAIAASCIATVFGMGFVLYAASEKMEAALVDQLLGEEINALVQHHRNDPAFRPSQSPNVSYFILAPGQSEDVLPVFARGLASGNHEIDIGDGHGDRDVAVRDLDGQRFIVIYDIGPYETREQEFRRLLLASLGAAALLSLWLGYAMAGVMTRQLIGLAARVDSLEPDAGHAVLSEPGQDREVATLARALDQYQARIRAMLLREQEFTANASHELRTPLTAIQTSCEMLARDAGLSTKSRDRVGFIAQAAAQMVEHVQALLLLARERELAEMETVNLLDCATQATAVVAEELERKQLRLVLDIAPHASVQASAQELRLVLGNLLRNAVRHTETGAISVIHAEDRLTVRDTGSGIDAERLPHIFERHYRDSSRSDGHGIGLDIVKRVCERAGWGIRVESTLAQGTVFEIRFLGIAALSGQDS